MAKKEPTTVTEEVVAVERTVDGAVTNPRSIQWPFDPHGFTSMLRKEGVRAVGRIKGDEDKLEIFIASLKVLGEHARTKIADQKADAKQAQTAAENRAKAVYARTLEDSKREAERLRRLADAAEANYQAQVAKEGEASEAE